MNLTKRNLLTPLAAAAILLLSGCASDRLNLGEYSQRSIFSAKGSSYKIGKPYKIRGQWYYPAEDYGYSEVGTALWRRFSCQIHGQRRSL